MPDITAYRHNGRSDTTRALAAVRTIGPVVIQNMYSLYILDSPLERSKGEKNTTGYPLAFAARTVRPSAALQRRLVHYSLCFIYPGEISNGSDLDVKETAAHKDRC